MMRCCPGSWCPPMKKRPSGSQDTMYRCFGSMPKPAHPRNLFRWIPKRRICFILFPSPAPLRWRVMNENAAVKAPHLLFGPITSLESLQRFKWHPYSRICPGTDRRKMLSLGDADTKICSSPNDGFRSKRRSRDVRSGLYAHTRTNPHSSVNLPRPGTTRGPDEKHRICCGPWSTNHREGL